MTRDWFQIFTNVAVIFGIALLIVEIRQANDHAAAQILDSNFQMNHVNAGSLMGDDPASAFAYPASTPLADLSPRDQVVVKAYYDQILVELEHRINLNRQGLYGDNNFRRAAIGRTNTAFFWRQDGRDYYERFRPYLSDAPIHQELRSIMDAALKLADEQGAVEFIAAAKTTGEAQ